jgi:hypothetical protein
MPDETRPLRLADIEPGRRYALVVVRHLLLYDRSAGVMSRKAARSRAAKGQMLGVCLMGRDVIALCGMPSAEEAKTLTERPETRGERERRLDLLGQQQADLRGRPVNSGEVAHHPRNRQTPTSAAFRSRLG